VNYSAFSDFLSNARDDEERTASGKLFQSKMASSYGSRLVHFIAQLEGCYYVVIPHSKW